MKDLTTMNRTFGTGVGDDDHNFTPFPAQTQEHIERNYGVKYKKDSSHPQKYRETLRGSNCLQNGHLERSYTGEIGFKANKIEATLTELGELDHFV